MVKKDTPVVIAGLYESGVPSGIGNCCCANDEFAPTKHITAIVIFFIYVLLLLNKYKN